MTERTQGELPTVAEQTEPLLSTNRDDELPRAVAVVTFSHRRNHSEEVRIEMASSFLKREAAEQRKFSDSQVPRPVTLVDDMGDKESFSKKKLSASRNVNLEKIEVPRPTLNFSDAKVSRTSPVSLSPLTHTLINTTISPISQDSQTRNGVFKMRVYLPYVSGMPETDEAGGDLAGYELEIEGGRQATAGFVVGLLTQKYDFTPEAFTLWMVSPLLEVQLKPHHVPYEVHHNWRTVINRFASDADEETLEADQPLLCLKRNVLLNHVTEDGASVICEPTLDLLFADAKNALLSGRYSLSVENAALVAGYSFAVDFSKYDDIPPTFNAEFVRKNIEAHLPEHLADQIRGPMVFGKTFSTSRLLQVIVDQCILTYGDVKNEYKKIKAERKCEVLSLTQGELKRKYIKHLRNFAPQYGSAFFRGSIERPSISTLKDVKRFLQSFTSGDDCHQITVSINRQLITVVDDDSHEMLLVQNISDCTWKKIECANSDDEQREKDSVLLLHFPVEVPSPSMKSKAPSAVKTNLLQIFGPQVVLMDAMLTSMKSLENIEKESESGQPSGNSSALARSASSVTSRDSSPPSGRITVSRTPSLTKCNRLCLASFENGKCVRANGSLKRVDWKKMQQMQSVH